MCYLKTIRTSSARLCVTSDFPLRLTLSSIVVNRTGRRGLRRGAQRTEIGTLPEILVN
jgi:hypothetical protein